MSRFTTALGSSIGAKLVMALTGLALLGFVLAHMIGNLQVFAGPEKINAYAHTLQNLGPILWAMRIGLLTIFGLHVWTAFKLWTANKAARPVPYAVVVPSASTYASRTMIWSGFIVLAFIVYHLLHFTLGAVQGDIFQQTREAWTAADGKHPDVYAMIVRGFRSPAVALSYVVAQLLLGLHLSHGVSSVFQTLGFTSPRLACVKKAAGPLVATVIVIGNCSIPLAILLGLVGKGVN
ncbi:MAG: succinate dehydrogenase cytochrome b subunit [Planctomycetes bacterium]|nr:succinate dehydrogenase cytochrome b subunit [Planctomycetota bacterium]